MNAWMGGARGLALFLSGFTLLNIAGELRITGFDANLWWIDLRDFFPAPVSSAPLSSGPHWLSCLSLSCVAFVIAAAAIRPQTSLFRARLTQSVLGLLLLATLRNCLSFWQLIQQGEIVTECPFPFSGLVSLMLTALIVSPWFGPRPQFWTRSASALACFTMISCAVLCPVAQMFCFGRTDYRRPADIAVVFGAKVFADGSPSLVLWDRVQTGCELYHQGLVRKLVLSGGPGSGPIDEPDAMARIARESGIPETDLILDRQGLNTQATVEHTVELARHAGWRRILAVSHAYHLPRIKLTFHRAECEVYTVPARESRQLKFIAWYMTREVAALWSYYLQPLRP